MLYFSIDSKHMLWNKHFNALNEFKQENGYHMDPKHNYIHKITHKDGKEEMLKLGKWCINSVLPSNFPKSNSGTFRQQRNLLLRRRKKQLKR